MKKPRIFRDGLENIFPDLGNETLNTLWVFVWGAGFIKNGILPLAHNFSNMQAPETWKGYFKNSLYFIEGNKGFEIDLLFKNS